MNTLVKYIKKAKNKGFFEIVLSSTIVKALMFLSAMFLPRFLSVSDYALLTYTETIIQYFLLISGLGLSSVILKYCSPQDVLIEEKRGYFSYTTVLGTGFNFVVALCFVVASLIVTYKIDGANQLVISMVGIPILSYLFQNLQYLLRADFENKKYAYLTIIYAVLYVLLQIINAINWGVYGVVIARYIAYFVCIIYGFYLNKNVFAAKEKKVEKTEKKEMLVFSLVLLCGSFFSTALLNNELLFVGNSFSDVYFANFKVSTYALQICVFFVESITIFILPYFSKHVDDKKWIWSNFKKVFFLNAMLMVCVTSLMWIFTKPFILLVWGEKYLGAVPIMHRLLLASIAQTVFRAIPGNVLAYVGGEKHTLVINICACIIQFAFNGIAFKTIGEVAAGYGLFASYLFSGILMTIMIRRLCKRS